MQTKRLTAYFLGAALVFSAITGCATPEPKKIDITNIPVRGGTIPSTPGSIWPGETSRNTLFQDLRARNVGDIVTIKITEKTSAIKEATTSTSRASTTDIGVQKFMGLPLNFGMRDFLGSGQPFSPEVQSSYDAAFDGAGTTKRSGELSAVISARVVEILPNGNLVLEGKKDTIVNNELQYVVLSGIVRPEDINEKNTVLSTLISDARIEYSGKGVIADEQRPGWMRRILDNVWPF
ncbi:MAG: flagellar basal body L-ring protein FlgH [Deltaproteobacteria bacterium]|nr:flagellar basal body L-ring protein FlgH [Deltaproteobacteria bacterium]